MWYIILDIHNWMFKNKFKIVAVDSFLSIRNRKDRIYKKMKYIFLNSA